MWSTVMRGSNSFASVVLSLFLIGSAGLPGLVAQSPAKPKISIMALTELKAGALGHYVTRAAINKADIDVMVDTGASVVALSYEDAEKVGLRPNTLDYKIPVSTANGTVNAARVKLDRVEIDTVRVDDVDAMVLPEGALNGTLLGMSFLAKLSSFRSENGVLTLKN
ncbi:MAG: TIGR02281 family clan AA aspartic protease [Alphaproteobacteria bacterium]|nr:TIGR02281 family clan AA aspartic protease [Alphaproteobacteria bacterium]